MNSGADLNNLTNFFEALVRRHFVATCVSVDLPRFRIHVGEKPASVFSVSVDLGRFRLVVKGTLDLLIGVRIPASQSTYKNEVKSGTENSLICPITLRASPFLRLAASESRVSSVVGLPGLSPAGMRCEARRPSVRKIA
jgi:hypothetical protein